MYLADTHVAAWWVLGDESLGSQSREKLGSGQPAWVSSISLAEMVIKNMTGRWDLPEDVPGRMIEQGFRILDVGGAHALALRKFPELADHDPFDRLLVAQAKVERFELLTADRRLLALDYDWIVDATR